MGEDKPKIEVKPGSRLERFGDKLVRWQPGQSGNPAGRPKGCKSGLRFQIRKQLAKKPPKEVLLELAKRGIRPQKKSESTYAEVIAMLLIEMATGKRIRARIDAMKIILEHTELPVMQDPADDDSGETSMINFDPFDFDLSLPESDNGKDAKNN